MDRLTGASRQYWLLQLAGWSAFGITMAFSRVGSFPFDYMFASKAVLAVLGLLTSHGLRGIYRRHYSADTSLARTVVAVVTLSYLAALAWTAPFQLIDSRIGEAMLGHRQPIESIAQLFYGSLYHAFVLLAWSALYLSITRHRTLLAERERALRAESLAHEARLQALRFQLRPHLLFNTLNAISTLIAEHRTTEAQRMISRLGDFLRHTLTENVEEEVPLRSELAFIDSYLQIEQARYEDRLKVEVDVPEEANDVLVPALVLQPVIENAIRHGVEPNADGGTVRIVAVVDGERLRITVSDRGRNGSGHNDVALRGLGGIGLRNVSERIEQLHGTHGRCSMESPPEGGVCVTIELPRRRATI